MKKNKQDSEQKNYLELLRNPEIGNILDLTGQSVQKLKNAKMKKVLRPTLEKVLPRRMKNITYSSYYRASRVKVLPLNPHFQKDVADIRALFQIPSKQIGSLDLTQFPHRSELWLKVNILPDYTIASIWLEIHRRLTKGITIDSDDNTFPPLPSWFLESARINPFIKNNLPNWLQKQSDIPELYAKMFDFDIPLERCVASLISRYQLPYRTANNLCFYILTTNSKYIDDLPTIDVTVNAVQRSIGKAFTLTVDWIDEFSTKEQWQRIWKEVVVPRQNKFWEQRGDSPHSKQQELDGFIERIKNEPWIFELYLLMNQRHISVDAALKQLSIEGNLPPEDIDRTAATRIIGRLDGLIKPLV